MKLSIVTPSYNQGGFIGQTLRNILNQKTGDFEIEYILLDAKSSDNTKDVVKKYSPILKKKGVQFTFICEKDKGQSDAINKGWKRVTGDIVTYINSDDYYSPGALRKVAKFFNDNPKIKWAYGGWNLVNKKGAVYKSYQPKSYSYAKLLNYCNIGQPSCFFRRELLKEFGDLDQSNHLAMDYDLWLRFASKYPAGIIPGILSNMRYYPDAKSGARTKEQCKVILKLGGKYTKLLSRRRIAQYYYYIRGVAVALAGLDITRRVSGKKDL